MMIRCAKLTTERLRFTRLLPAISAAMLLAAGANADITPVELVELLPADGAADDFFGTAVGIDGDFAIVGSRWDDDFGLNAGSAYIYRKNASGDWIQQVKLIPLAGDVTGQYGGKVAISGDTAIVSAAGGSENGINSGKVYIYHRDASGSWSQLDIIIPNVQTAGMLFGRDVAIDGDRLIVGATSSSNPGAAYIFTRDAGNNWSQTAKLEPAGLADDPSYGYSVDIDGDTAIVGAIHDDGFGFTSGSAFVYQFQSANPFGGDTWNQQAKLISHVSTITNFGFDVSVDDQLGVAVVGAPEFWTDVNLRRIGAAYFFKRDGFGDWTQTDFVLASDPGENDLFGYSVSIDDNAAIISAYHNLNNAGAAYVFSPDVNGNWSEQAKLIADDAADQDEFGYSIALDGNTAFIGAPRTDDMGSSAGSAYLFNIHQCTADLNADGEVDTADLGILIGEFATAGPTADINGDGFVDTADLGVLIGVFGPCTP